MDYIYHKYVNFSGDEKFALLVDPINLANCKVYQDKSLFTSNFELESEPNFDDSIDELQYFYSYNVLECYVNIMSNSIIKRSVIELSYKYQDELRNILSNEILEYEVSNQCTISNMKMSGSKKQYILFFIDENDEYSIQLVKKICASPKLKYTEIMKNYNSNEFE